MPRAALILCFLVIPLTACTPESKTEAPKAEGAPEQAAAPKPTETAPAAKPPRRVTARETRLFGIKIPSGMRPARGPDKVYRFVGNAPMPQVKVLIEDQITTEQKLREVEGWLFRNARAKAEGEGGELIAIRVFEKGKGSAVDLWIEKDYSDALPDRASTAGGYAGRPSPKSQKMIQERRIAREKSLSKTLSTMKKLERREPLTKEELESDVFN